MTTWILLADASRARVFAVEDKVNKLTLVRSFEHALSRAHAADIVSDKPGSMRKSPGQPKSNMEPQTGPKEVEAGVFVAELAAFLKSNLNSHAYGALVIAASPHFLGLLRERLDPQVSKVLTKSINRDYTQVGEHELPAQLKAGGVLPVS